MLRSLTLPVLYRWSTLNVFMAAYTTPFIPSRAVPSKSLKESLPAVSHGAALQDADPLCAINALLSTLMKPHPDAECPYPERVHRQSQRLGQLLLAFLVQNTVLDN